jgi:hypothetical protein
MKFLKLFESWHQDYSYDFSDRGFELSDSSYGINKTLSGKYKGKYVLTELNDEFADMISRISYDYDILKFKTYFNSTTGNASFEIELSDKIDTSSYIEFEISGEKHKYFPIKVSFISLGTERFYGNDPSIRLSGKLESGADRELILIKKSGRPTNKLNLIIQGLTSKRPTIDKENIKRIFDMIDSDKIINDYVDKYSEIKKIITE